LRVMPAAPSREPSARRARSFRPVRPSWAALRSLAGRTWAGHRLFVIVLTPAFLLRVDAELGYRWQVWFNDSFDYVQNTVHFKLDPTRVSGYEIWLKILQPLHSYAVVTILQHLMGLGVAVMIYALARHRFGVPAWLAVLATVPVLYDGFQIQLEHLIMADVLYLFLLMLAMTLLLWNPAGPSMRTSVLVGLLLGIGDVVRSVGLPMLVIFAVYMIIRRVSWRKVAAAVVVCFLPVVAYAGAFDLEHGQFAMTESTGVFLYSRVMTFAECAKMTLTADELSLCTTVPPSQRPIAQAYIWTSTGDTPLDRFSPSKFSPTPNQLAEKFAVEAIKTQPAGYAKAVFDDTWRAFGWSRVVFPNGPTYQEYLFGYHSLPIPAYDVADLGPYGSYAAAYGHGNPLTNVVAPFANVMRVYERHVYLPGTGYGLILLIGLGGLVLAWRRFGGEALLPWTVSLALIVIPAATAEFDYRYVLAAVPFGSLAAVMAFAPDTAGGRLVRRLAVRRRLRPGVPGTPAASPAVARSGLADVTGPSDLAHGFSGLADVTGPGSARVAGARSGSVRVGGGTEPATAGTGDDQGDLTPDGA
jgi:hypothetical protein